MITDKLETIKKMANLYALYSEKLEAYNDIMRELNGVDLNDSEMRVAFDSIDFDIPEIGLLSEVLSRENKVLVFKHALALLQLEVKELEKEMLSLF